MFHLDPMLQNDTFFIKKLSLSDLLLMNNKNFPWFILVPNRKNITEIFELNKKDQLQLWHEISEISEFTKKHFNADKINIAALGNKVPQLHIHIIARFKTDLAWPNPVWGHASNLPYTHEEIEAFKESVVPFLNVL